MTHPRQREFDVALAAVRAAGDAINEFYTAQTAGTYAKSDGSAVTDADLEADRIIRSALSKAYPDDAILTEEGVDDPNRLARRRVWIVDPIDGTNQFIGRTGQFEVLIALVEAGRPVVAVMHQPTTGLSIGAIAGAGAWTAKGSALQPLSLTPAPKKNPPRLATSIWLGGPENGTTLTRVAARLGSAPPEVSELGVTVRPFLPPDNQIDALIGWKVQGDPTMAWEWDFAPADLIVNEAGGRLTDLSGQPLRYNKRHPRNEGGLLLAVDPVTHGRVLDAIVEERRKSTA